MWEWKRSRWCGVTFKGLRFQFLEASLFTLLVTVSGARRTDGTGESTLVSKETVHLNRKSDVIKRPIGCQFHGLCHRKLYFHHKILRAQQYKPSGDILRYVLLKENPINPFFSPLRTKSQQQWLTDECQLPFSPSELICSILETKAFLQLSLLCEGWERGETVSVFFFHFLFFFLCQQLWHGFSRWRRITIWIFPSTSGEQSCDYWD